MEEFQKEPLPNGTEVTLPLGEEGVIRQYNPMPFWSNRYLVQITKDGPFHKKGEYDDYKVSDVKEKEKETMEEKMKTFKQQLIEQLSKPNIVITKGTIFPGAKAYRIELELIDIS
jgi:hypothetical protein